MQKFNSRDSEWDFSLDQNWGARPVRGDPQPQSRVGQLLAMIVQMKGYSKRGKVSGRDGDGCLWCIDPGNNVIEPPAIEYGYVQLR